MTKTMTATQNTEYSVPILESGDRLTRHEFERRYQSMPHLKKAELIEGVVYVASPLRYSRHGQPHSDIMTWLGVYRAATPGIGLAGNRSTIGLVSSPSWGVYPLPARRVRSDL
jgi:hypothetical protein